MADRRCPYCGELVPSTSLTCPKCYKQIPKEPEPVRRESTDGGRGDGGTRRPSRKIALVLAVVPALVGLLGLGMIYNNPRQKIGYIALVLGLLVFAGAVVSTFTILLIPVAVLLWIVYVLMFLACILLTALGNIFVRIL